MNHEQLHPKKEFKSIRHVVEYAAKTYGNNTAFSYRLKPSDKEKEFNKNAVPYKKINVVKIRKEDFPKNTLRKIMRFKLDMTID